MLNLKPTHRVIQTYYSKLPSLQDARQTHEGAVAPAFAKILDYCAAQVPHLDFIEQYNSNVRANVRYGPMVPWWTGKPKS
jgi:hypothetical protein